MTRQPTLETERLILRPFEMADGPEVRRLAGDPEVAGSALNIPEPFEEGMAEAWIATHADAFARGELAAFAVTTKVEGRLIGAVGLTIHRPDDRAELGYWVARHEWGRGYATEAAVAMISFGFKVLGLHRIHADCLARNPASARVLSKSGMTFEGRLRQHALKRGVYEDLDLYGILRGEYPAPTFADRS